MSNDPGFLSVENLTLEVPGLPSERRIGLRRIELSLAPGEILALAGEAGSGASLLLQMIAGIADPRVKVLTGELRFEGRTLLSRRRDGVALRRGPITILCSMAAAPADPERRVRDWLRDLRPMRRPGGQGWSEAFLEVGLLEPETLVKRRLVDLPLLDRHRLGLARALILGSRLLLCEEVEKDLDPLASQHFGEILRRIRDTHGIGILVAGGSMRRLARYADRLGVLFEGALLELGEAAAVLSEPLHRYTAEFRDCEVPPLGVLPDFPPISRRAIREAEEAMPHHLGDAAEPAG